jgi:DNA mismatch repair protein MutS2
MQFYPNNALEQLEFHKVKEWLLGYAKTFLAKKKIENLLPDIEYDAIEKNLFQTQEYTNLLRAGLYIPNQFSYNISPELKLLSAPGATLGGEQFLQIKSLALNADSIFRWFGAERRESFPYLALVLNEVYYEKEIVGTIDEVLEDNGQVKDSASEDLKKIRLSLFKRRNEQRRIFERLLSKFQKQGYVANIEESFINGRRVIAVMAEQKRTVKGIMHGESDSRKTTFIEPEETIEINNEIYELEYQEKKEVERILKLLTATLSAYYELLAQYFRINGQFDFIYAKAKIAIDYNGHMPMLEKQSVAELVEARHPLLLRYNNSQQKPTIPFTLALNQQQRILIISGPNAGGKTVTLKTLGLLQIMLQCGLLMPARPESKMGVFKKLFIHIGDTQSLEFELSTYSSHLKHMKHFLEEANGRTMFMIDELGGGSDPNLGSAFAEVILEELAHKHAIGIVTTHYLNLKLMANNNKGIINAAMGFDEKKLEPLYKLLVGKPGSSYTFAIAERIGLKTELIERAKNKVDNNHFKLDKLLNRTEQDLKFIEQKEKKLNATLSQNEQLKKQLSDKVTKEKHEQQVNLLKEQNKIKEEQLAYLKETERKLKAMAQEWKKTDDNKRPQLMKQFEAILFNKKESEKQTTVLQKKLDKKYEELKEPIAVGKKVKLIRNHQVGIVESIKGKIIVVKIGAIPMQLQAEQLVVVKEKEKEKEKNNK